MTIQVVLSRRAMSDLQSVPMHIVVKLKSWIDLVETSGLAAARRIPGYHDEPLKGARTGQRSIRLSRSYRAFYTIEKSSRSDKIIVQEVNKHDY